MENKIVTLKKIPRKKGSLYGDEDHEQIKVVQYLDLQYPHVLYFHVPNQRQSKVQFNVKLKRMGVKKGVPDLWITNPASGFVGLVIEMKSEGGRTSHEQEFWLDALRCRGWAAFSCRSFESAKRIIDDYFNNRI